MALMQAGDNKPAFRDAVMKFFAQHMPTRATLEDVPD
jgi:hypothetical protein